jgi:hypothetical protein
MAEEEEKYEVPSGTKKTEKEESMAEDRFDMLKKAYPYPPRLQSDNDLCKCGHTWSCHPGGSGGPPHDAFIIGDGANATKLGQLLKTGTITGIHALPRRER